jgi:hypothetical protein
VGGIIISVFNDWVFSKSWFGARVFNVPVRHQRGGSTATTLVLSGKSILRGAGLSQAHRWILEGLRTRDIRLVVREKENFQVFFFRSPECRWLEQNFKPGPVFWELRDSPQALAWASGANPHLVIPKNDAV